MCAQYFVIASCSYMHRDNRCVYMAHCSDCGMFLVHGELLKIVF